MKNILLLAILFTSIAATAQSSKDSATRFFYVGVGYQYQSFGQLANRIATHPEYTRPGSSYAGFSVGLNREVRHLVTDVNFNFASSMSGDDEKRSSTLMSFGTSVTLGYNFSTKANFRFYPFVGISGEFYLAQFNKDVSGISFDSILVSNTVQQRTEPTVFTNNFLCYQGGLAVDFVNTKYRLLRSVGLRASYTGGFKNHSWRVNENQLIANAPVDKVSQFNIAVQFGVGRTRKNSM